MESPYDTSQQRIEDSALVNWPRVAAVSAMVSFSIPTFMTGIELFTMLSWHQAWITLLIGGALLTLVGGFMGSIGAQTRNNSYMLVQIAFGEKGATLLNVLFAISLTGWFGLNLDLFSSSVVTIIDADSQSAALPIAIEAVAGSLMIATTMYGFNIINRLSIVLVPVMIVVSAILLYQSNAIATFSNFTQHNTSLTGSISQGVSLIVGVIVIGAIILPDITRFSRQRRGGMYTAFWSYLVAQSVVIVIAGYAAYAFNAHNVLDVLLTIGIGSWSLLIVIAGSWILNALNLYSAELAITANTSKVSHKVVATGLGIVGMIAAFANILDIFVLFLSILTAVFIPVAGIIAVDFFIVNKQAYFAPGTVLNDASGERETTKTTLKVYRTGAIVAWAVGACIAGFDLIVPTSLVTGIAALDAILVSAAIHLLVYKGVNRFALEQTQ